jgi:hypothetical protein
MKFVFENKTEPTLYAEVVITVVITSSNALATIGVSFANLSVVTYCIAVLALVIWLRLMKTSP